MVDLLEGEGVMIKKLILLVLLSAAFLFGYDRGRVNNSPDIVGWLKVKSAVAYEVGKDMVAGVSDKTKNMTKYEDYPR